jgi:hypothetical protein
MNKSEAINCYNCKSTILYLPKEEIKKFNGLNFVCENCGHHNLLKEFTFFKGLNNDPYHDSVCIKENLAI